MSESPADAARACLLAAIRAADPRGLTARAIGADRTAFARRSVELIAVGKAAVGMVQGAAEALGDALHGGVAIAPATSAALPAGVVAFAGGHPMPNEEGARGGEAIERLLRDAGGQATVLALISGGASALMTLPAEGLTLDDIVRTSRALMLAGADIRELNCVRKHLDRLKGGLMAKIFSTSRIQALVLSDVIGDPLDVIASGPLVADATTYADAIEALSHRKVWDSAPKAVRDHLVAGARGDRTETPKQGDPCFDRVEIRVIGNNALAVEGAAEAARQRGFAIVSYPETIVGEARDAGAAFAAYALACSESADRPLCVVGGGETTVTVRGSGVGGRNLEFAAAAARALEGGRGIVIGSIGTDGIDGPSGAAGAVVNEATAGIARAAGLGLDVALANNDTLAALNSSGAVLVTGPTGTNVMDVQIALLTPKDRRPGSAVFVWAV